MQPSPRSLCECCAGAGAPCERAADGRREAEELRAALAEATAEACAAYEDNARLVRVLSVIAQPSPPETLSNEVLLALSQAYNAALVCLARLVGDRLVVLGACGLPEADPAFTDGWPAGPAALEALRGGEAVGLAGTAPAGALPEALAGLGIRSAAWVPVRSDVPTTDLLLVLLRRSGDALPGTELRCLESVATRLAVAVEARERVVLAEKLARSGHRLARHLSFPALYRDASVLLQELLGTRRACVVTLDAGSADRAWAPPLVGDVQGCRWPRPVEALPGWPVLAAGGPYRTAADDASPLCGAGTGRAAVLGIPVMNGTRPAALLYAVRDPARPFRPGEVEAATTFANYLHSAMINTELYQALKQSETVLRHRAAHDALTGLANRTLVGEYLTDALGRPDPGGVGLLFCDLDRFKGINDRLGHGVGDTLLCLVAERLRECVRPDVLLARLGGDEFVFVLDGVSGLDELARFGGRVTAAMARPFSLGGEVLRVSLSVGGVWGGRGQATPMSMLRDADAAMYAAKAKGSGLVRVFDDDASLQAREQLAIRSDLHSALERGQLAVHYQPIFELVTGEIVAFEVLLRWHHPQRGTIPAERFVPLAEESGDIVPIGSWALAEACRQLARWRRLAGPRRLALSVNLSPVQLHRPELAVPLLDTVRAAGVDPGGIWFEITESGALHEADAREFVARTRGAGVHFSLDDFGTSYSNLSHLRRLPVERLKIDRSFVAGLTAEGHRQQVDRGLVQAILAIGGSLGLTVVAEGVETAEQRALLAGLGCQLGQGFLLSAAVPAAEVTRLLLSGARLPRLAVPSPPADPCGETRSEEDGIEAAAL